MSITKAKCLKLFREVIGVCFKTHRKHHVVVV